MKNCPECNILIRSSHKRCWSCHLKNLEKNRKQRKCIECEGKVSFGAVRCIDCINKLKAANKKPYFNNFCSICNKKVYKSRIPKFDALCSSCAIKISHEKMSPDEKKKRGDKIKRSIKEKYKNLEYIEKRKISQNSDAYKEKLRISSTERWKNKEYKEKVLRKTLKSNRVSPNKPERKLIKVLNFLFPKEYKFVGDGEFFIEGFNPDFININGQKKIIELYGDYWHSLPNYQERDKKRILAYEKYGYKTLIVWEHELLNPNSLVEKLNSFSTEETKD